MRYQNPSNRKVVVFDAFIGAPFIIMSIMALILGLGPFDGIAILAIVGGSGAGVIILGWHREYYHRPIIVEVNDQGIIMDFRYSKQRVLQWDGIAGVYSEPGKKEILDTFADGVGTIIPWHGLPYFVTFQVSEAIREKYRKVNTKDIPLIGAYEKDRRFRKRVRMEMQWNSKYGKN